MTTASLPLERTVSHERYLGVSYFGCLDGIRFLCIFAVLWHHHALRRIYGYNELSDIVVRGHVGVDFFFILSGFLITTLLLRERSKNGRIDLRKFYRRRAIRILPVYYFVVTITAIWVVGVNGETHLLSKVPYYFLFLSNFLREHIELLDPTWSLSMEEQYYMIWPAVLLLMPRKWIVPALVIGIAVNVLGVMGAFRLVGIVPTATDHLLFSLSGPTYAPILMGTLLAIMLHSKVWFERIAIWLRFKLAAPLLFLALLVLLHFLPGPLEGLPNLVLHSAMCLMLASVVVREDNGLAFFLRFKPFVRIGQISYGIYLYHMLVRAGVAEVMIRFEVLDYMLVFFVLYLLISIIVAEISFRTLERIFLRYRN